MSDTYQVKVDGTIVTDLEITSISYGYPFGSEATLFYKGPHDVGLAYMTNNNDIQISTDGFLTLIFRGRLSLNNPRGVLREGVSYRVDGLERVANRYKVKYNSSLQWVYNQDNNLDFYSPNASGRPWTVGQIMVDILEHALGLTTTSAIPKHHPFTTSVTDPYLPSTVLTSYNATALLALNRQMGTVRVKGENFWTMLLHLLDFADHHGLYIDPTDPTNPTLTVWNYADSTPTPVYFGVIDSHVDDPSYVPNVKDSDIKFSLDGCKTKIIIEGRPSFQENLSITMIDNSANDGSPPGTSWIAKDPIYRRMAVSYFSAETGTTIHKLSTGDNSPRLVGIDPNTVTFDIERGIAYSDTPLTAPVTAQAFYAVPVQVVAGPGGSAYTNYGVVIEEGIFDAKFSASGENDNYAIYARSGQTIHYPTLYSKFFPESSVTSSGSSSSGAGTIGIMQDVASALLARLGDERVSAEFLLDNIDFDTYNLQSSIYCMGLTGSQWDTLNAQVMKIDVDIQSNSMRLFCSNDIYKNEVYPEFRRRFIEMFYRGSTINELEQRWFDYALGFTPTQATQFLGRVTTSSPKRDSYITVNPVRLRGAETDGGSGVKKVNTGITVTVFVDGQNIPNINDDVVCQLVEDRWVVKHIPVIKTVCLVSSTPNSSGLYDAVIQEYNIATNTWTTGESIWVVNANP